METETDNDSTKCCYCKQPFPQLGALRPYGPGGAFTCFPCAMKPENKAIAQKALHAALDAAGPVPVFTATGPKNLNVILDIDPEAAALIRAHSVTMLRAHEGAVDPNVRALEDDDDPKAT